MMMHLRMGVGLFALCLLSATILPATAQQRDNSRVRASPNAAVSQTIGTTQVDLSYGRPAVKGRTVFGELQAWGEVWRAGANEPTTVTFSDAVVVEGQPLEAGTYNLFLRPMETGAWDVIFTTPVRWGTMFDQATPVATVKATPTKGGPTEWLTYRFEDLSDTTAVLQMHWADVVLPIHIATAP